MIAQHRFFVDDHEYLLEHNRCRRNQVGVNVEVDLAKYGDDISISRGE